MDTILSNQAPSHPSSTLLPKETGGAAGENCPECSEVLPEQQKEWWPSCATRAVGHWMSSARDADSGVRGVARVGDDGAGHACCG